MTEYNVEPLICASPNQTPYLNDVRGGQRHRPMTTNETSHLETVFALLGCLMIAFRGDYYDLMPARGETQSCGVCHACYSARGVREPLLRSDQDPHASIRRAGSNLTIKELRSLPAVTCVRCGVER